MSTTATRTARPASPASRNLMITIGKETREAAGDSETRNRLVDIFAGAIKRGEVTSQRQVSEMIEALKELKRNWRDEDRAAGRSADAGAEPDPGMYRQPDGTIVRVYLGQNSGRMLLKQLVGTPNGEHTHEYEYVGAAAKHLHSDAKPLTIEEAKEFGRMTGSCCVCARRLDNPESVEAGIGPVCGRKMEQGFTR